MSAIARKLDLDRKTVRKYIQRDLLYGRVRCGQTLPEALAPETII